MKIPLIEVTSSRLMLVTLFAGLALLASEGGAVAQQCDDDTPCTGTDPCVEVNAPPYCSCLDDPWGCPSGNGGFNSGTGGGTLNNGGQGNPPGGTIAVPTPGSAPGNSIPGPTPNYASHYTPNGVASGFLNHDINQATSAGYIVQRDALGNPVAYVKGKGLPRGVGFTRSLHVRDVDGTDPVSGSGEFVVDETDVTFPGYGIPFTFTRHYRSGVDYQSSLGFGWNHDFARRIAKVTTLSPRSAQRCSPAVPDVVYVDGHMNTVRFVYASTSGSVDSYTPASPADLQLTFDHAASLWTLVDDGTTVSTFDGTNGTLRAVSDHAGHSLTVQWDTTSYSEWADIGGVVTSVVDTTGRVIHFNYAAVTMVNGGPKLVAHILSCVSLAADCDSTPPLVSFESRPMISVDSDKSYLETDLTAVHKASGTSFTYSYSMPGAAGYSRLAPIWPSDEVDPTCHRMCDAPNTCASFDVCQASVNEVKQTLCDTIHRGPYTSYYVTRDPVYPINGFVAEGPVNYSPYNDPNQATANECMLACMVDKYHGGSQTDYQGALLTCVGEAVGVRYDPLAIVKLDHDPCVTYYQECMSQVATLQANVPACRDSCFTTCRANHIQVEHGWIYGPFSYGQTPPPAIAHNLVRVTDGEGRIVVDNEYGVDPRQPDFDRIKRHSRGAALGGSAATTMTFEYHDLRVEAQGYGTPNPIVWPIASFPQTTIGKCWGDAQVPAYATVEVNAVGAKRVFYYDASWRLLRVVNQAGGGLSDFLYSGDHLVATKTPGGVVSCLDVDAFGRPTTITRYPAPNYHAVPQPVVTKITYDAAGELLSVVEDATGGAPRGVAYMRDAAERVIAEGRQVTLQAASWTCYQYDDTALGSHKPSSSGGVNNDPAPTGTPVVAMARSSIATVASAMAAKVMPSKTGGGGGTCPAWGCNHFPLLAPSGCALSVTPSPHAGDASYLRAVVPSTITRPDGSLVVASGIQLGGPTDLVVTDTDGVTPLRESYVDFDAYGRPAATGRVVAGKRAPGTNVATTYDATSGRLLKEVRDPANGGDQATTSFTYDKGGHLHLLHAPTFNRTIDIDGAGHLVGVSDAARNGYRGDPRRSCFNIDAEGRVHDVIHPEGDGVHYDYDPTGDRVVAVSRGALASYGAWASGCVQLAPAAMETFARYQFDSTTGFPKSRVIDGREIDYTLDGFGRVVDEVQFGHTISVIVPNGPGGIKLETIVINLHHWRNYNAFDEVTLDTSYDYFQDLKFPAPDFVEPQAATPGMHWLNEYSYDRLGRPTMQSSWRFIEPPSSSLTAPDAIPDPAGAATSYLQYDDAADTITRSDIDGHATIETSDPLGRPLRRSTAAGESGAISESYTWTSGATADALDIVTATRSPAPTSTGQLVRTVTFDAHGLERTVREADRVIATTAYDDNDHPRQATSVEDGTETFDVDGYGRLVTVHRPFDGGDASVTTTWDRDDRVVGVTDGAQHSTSYTYDAQGRAATETTPLGTTTRSYMAGRAAVQTVTAPGGISVKYGYGVTSAEVWPGDGRLLSRSFWRGSAVERSETYAYSNAGLLAGVQLDTGSTWTRTFDSLGRVVTDTQPGTGVTLRRSYATDSEQVVLDTGTPTTATIARTFDAQHRVASVAFNGAPVATFDYGVGALGGITYGNGVTQSWSYDDRTRLVGTRVVKGSPVAGNSALYGADNVPRARSRTLGSYVGTDLFTADSLARVTGENLGLSGMPSMGGGTVVGNVRDLANEDVQAAWSATAPSSSFTFDGADNWTARGGSNAFTPTIDGLNRYTSIGSDTVGYDVAGNVTTYRDETYVFDAAGELTSATKGGATTTYGYDGFGRRAYEQSGGHYTHYLWDGDSLLAIEPDGDPTRAQLRIGAGSNDTLALADAFGQNPLHYVHAGTDGSSLAVTDAWGTLVEGYAYSAFGDTTVLDTSGRPLASSRVNNRFLFQGQLYDPQLGAYAMRAREYKPAWGRFLSADPAGLAFADNRYAFVGGRPLTLGDPSGLAGETLRSDPHFQGFRDWSADYDQRTTVLGKMWAAPNAGATLLFNEVGRELDNLLGLAAHGIHKIDPDGALGFGIYMHSLDTHIVQVGVAGSVLNEAETAILQVGADGEKALAAEEALARQRLAETIRLRGRSLELGWDVAKKAFNPAEAVGGPRIEQGLGRQIANGTHEGVDFVDRILGNISLKGPLLDGVVDRPGVLEGMANRAVKDAQGLNTASNAVFVDLYGLSPQQVAKVKSIVEAAAPSFIKPFFYLEP